MTASPLLDRLRPGLDPNGSTWAVLRYPADWRAGSMAGLTFDSAKRALRLAPASPQPGLESWYPDDAVTGAAGTIYRVDRRSNQVLVRRACDADFTRLPGFGGKGFATGRLNHPTSVAVDLQGRLYVADTGNARVQVVLPDSGEVAAVLEDGLLQPVHAAIARDGTIFVADEGTRRIHRFDSRFAPIDSCPLATLDPWTSDPWSQPPDARPRAVAVQADGSVAVFDPRRAMLWHMTPGGEPLPALPWPDNAYLPAGWRPLPQRSLPRGEIVLGPIDGGVPGLAWHKALFDATLPEGTSIRVQSYASDRQDSEVAVWAPDEPVPITAAETGSREGDRLILPDQQGWALWKAGRLLRASSLVHRLETLPAGAMAFDLPHAAASRLFEGDSIVLEGGLEEPWHATVSGVSTRVVTLSAAGPAAAFEGSGPISLVERDGRPLPFGPLDLGFLGLSRSALNLDALTLDGLPQEAALPHDFAALLARGDILALGENAYIEILDLGREDATVTVDAPLPETTGTTALRIQAASRRLLVQGDLPSVLAPPGAFVTVLGDVHAVQVPIAAVGGDTIWPAQPLAGQVDATNWVAAQFPTPVATDRGRYLWLRVQFEGQRLPPGTGVNYPLEAAATPLLRAIRIIAPRPSMLGLLPALYSRGGIEKDAPGSNFLERFLTLFEGELTRIETAFDSVSRLLNSESADAGWLDFIGSWLDLSFDPSWPIERRRQLVREAASLQAGQGTPRALQRYLEIYTGQTVSISESFRRRPPPPIQLGARGPLGVAPLGHADAADEPGLAHHFSVGVDLPGGEARPAARSAVLNIIATMKPAHTRFTLDTRGTAPPRIGMGAMIDDITIPGASADPCACDPDPAAALTRSGNVETGFLVGGRLGRGGAPEPAVTGG